MEINNNELISFFDNGYYNPSADLENLNISNLKKSEILILCSSEVDFLIDTEKILLKNILKAVGVNIDEVNLIVNSKITVKEILNIESIKMCFLFGFNAKDVSFYGIPQMYQAFNFNNITFLFADSLKELNTNDTNNTNKKYLWHALQKIFK